MAERKQKLSGKYRNKFLGILRLLNEESDVDNPLSTQDIIRKLGREGIAIDRRTLSREIDIMRANGILAEETKMLTEKALALRMNMYIFIPISSQNMCWLTMTNHQEKM